MKISIQHVFCMLLLFIPISVYALDIDSEDCDLDLDITVIPEFQLGLPSLNRLFRLDSASLSLEGETKKNLSFKIGLDFSELLDNSEPDYSKIPENCYLQYRFYKELKLRAGLFKLPVSEGLFLGPGERPALDHFYSTGELAPGRNIGLMIHGKKILNIFGYALGIFNSTPLAELADAQSDLALASKIYAKTKLKPFFEIKAGYSAYYSFSEIFTHSFFADLKFIPSDRQTFSLFAEYLEQRYYHYYWNHAVTASLSWRYAFLETFFSFELFDRNSGEDHADDRIILSPGLNFYSMKDALRIGIQYFAEKKNECCFSHTVSIYSVLKL